MFNGKRKSTIAARYNDDMDFLQSVELYYNGADDIDNDGDDDDDIDYRPNKLKCSYKKVGVLPIRGY